MFKNYFKTAWRNFWKAKVFSAINLIGLSAGLTCFTIILLYVENERSFDDYHRHADHIYRVVKDFVNSDGSKIPDATTPPALAPALQKDLSEVAAATRLSQGRRFLVQYQENRFYETNFIQIDSNFFDVFDFPFVRGNKTSVFNGSHTILLTQASAKKYFGNNDPVGKMLRINLNNGQDLMVMGVLKDVPKNSHFTFDFLIPFSAVNNTPDNNNWVRSTFYTYVLLKSRVDPVAFTEKVQPLFRKYQPDTKDLYYAQRLTDIHLKSNLKLELAVNGDLSYIKILLVIAFSLILIAGINYVNLITAQSIKRAKEVGVRKVAGASQRLLIIQFLVESVCTAFASFFISLIAVFFLLPIVNQLLDRDLTLFSGSQLLLWIELTVIVFAIGVAAGLYPALQLSSYRPVKVLKGKFIASRRGTWLRKALVVFQFSISIVLIVGFITIYRQIDFVRNKNLGFDQNNILLLPNLTAGVESRAMIDELNKIPGITNVARADGILGSFNSINGIASPKNNDHISLNFMRIDHAFLPALQIELKEGRNFFAKPGGDSASIILNEKAVEQLGLKKPLIGQPLLWDDEAGRTHPVRIVGIAKDFNFTSLHEPIKAFGFLSVENNGPVIFLKMHSRDLSSDIALIQKIWIKYYPDKPFEYSFQDEQIARLYKSDLKFRVLFSCITFLALLVACLGLFGLSIFTAEARAKEIGIRKVLGASVSSLFADLSKVFLWPVVIAMLIAFPISWWVMYDWLQKFAYHIGLTWWVFAMAAGVSVFIALLTVSFQSAKAAVANPIKSLRME